MYIDLLWKTQVFPLIILFWLCSECDLSCSYGKLAVKQCSKPLVWNLWIKSGLHFTNIDLLHKSKALLVPRLLHLCWDTEKINVYPCVLIRLSNTDSLLHLLPYSCVSLPGNCKIITVQNKDIANEIELDWPWSAWFDCYEEINCISKEIIQHHPYYR